MINWSGTGSSLELQRMSTRMGPDTTSTKPAQT